MPRYRQRWSLDYASLRPIEEAGRKLPYKKRNDLLHTDAFPTRPTQGGLILRMFWNLHPARPRVWWTSDPFEIQATRYATAAGLGRIAHRGRLAKTVLRRLGLPLAERSDYDEFMLAFHDYLKSNAEFQANCPKYRLESLPGAAWMAFTDVVPHSVESGQFAMEQTLIVPRDALAVPRARRAILEKLAAQPCLTWGRPLSLGGPSGGQADDTIRSSAPRPYGATAMVTLFDVVTPPIWICNDTALPVGVLAAGVTAI